MSTITAPLRRPSTTIHSPLAPARTRIQRALRHLRRVNEGLNSDDRASVSDLTLRPYTEVRYLR